MITKTIETIHGNEITKFFCNGILIATCTKYREFFCTVDKQGRPSNIRDKVKWAKQTTWKREGLRELFGNGVVNEIGKEYIFRDDYPDLTFGYAGSVLTASKIKEAIKKYETKYFNEIGC